MGWPSANNWIALLTREGFGVCATIAATPSRRHVAANKQRFLFIQAKHYYIAAKLARPATGRRQAGDRPATGRRQAGDRPATGRRQAGDRPATGRRQAGGWTFPGMW